MRRVTLGVVLAACMAAGPASAAQDPPVEFSATRILSVPEGELVREKVYVGHGYRRVETPMDSSPGEPAPVRISLQRLESSRETFLEPTARTAMELENPFPAPWPDVVRWMVVRGASPCTGRPELTCEPLGTERVGRFSTQKWRVVPQEPSLHWAAVTAWVAPGLGGIIVRTEDPAGMRTELTDIHPGPQPESLFEVPDGYVTVSGLAPEGGGSPP